MAAASPRCIQQPLLTDTSIPVKPLDSSPISSPAAPSSYDSELDPPSSLLLHSASDEQTSSSTPSHLIHHRPAQLTGSTKCSVHHSSPPSSPNSSSLHQPVYTKSSSHRPWISALLATKFYGPCPKHSTLRKNDLNLFCTNHAVKICQYCNHCNHSHKATSRNSCTVLHVSRYMYHDVLLAKEAAALLDVSEVQSYLNNGNRVVYIDRRAQPKSKLAPHAKACAVCSRTLQDPYRFCSVFCRLAHAKDPAAASSLPVPDACPLLQQPVRKPKTHVEHLSSTHSKRTERFVKRFDRCITIRSPPQSPVTPTRSAARSSSIATPPLQLLAIRKNYRRKGEPSRSPLASPRSIFLFHDVDMLA